ncbi:adenine specific DNA methylase [Candidatus Brocadia sinica JPN1]|uniref:Adenine specific DNA methylase n=1 Tax=Candidatus Brocadia sinica JPN1 TaxID=1197129 RepID=A0ABQ0K0L5_9BACT|nr:adenine specific DNA methylase [Candidatus Brocadia sinica JPN1]
MLKMLSPLYRLTEVQSHFYRNLLKDSFVIKNEEFLVVFLPKKGIL